MATTTKRLRTVVLTYQIQSAAYSIFRMPNIEYKCTDAHTIDVLLFRHYDTMALSHVIWDMVNVNSLLCMQAV